MYRFNVFCGHPRGKTYLLSIHSPGYKYIDYNIIITTRFKMIFISLRRMRHVYITVHQYCCYAHNESPSVSMVNRSSDRGLIGAFTWQSPPNDSEGTKKAASGNPQIPDTAELTTNRGDRT